MTKIVIISGIQIINNPRVVKEATVLSNAGYEVEVIGAILDKESNKSIQRMLNDVDWKHSSVIDLSTTGFIIKFDYFFLRLKRKIAIFLKRRFNLESKNQLGYFVSRLYQMAKNRDADLYIVHLEQALWVGKRLLQEGHKVAIDVEDWYSEDGLLEDRAFRPVNLLFDCEAFLLNKAVYCTTTSKALSYALMHAYQCPLPKVVYNSFPLSERVFLDNISCDRRNFHVTSIVWFSQTIGPGRGLEELILALNKIESEFELHIRGEDNRGFFQVLLNMASMLTQKRIFYHEKVLQDKLLSRLSEHDIGYCGDLSDCKNRDLTVTNKMLEYFRAGLAVVATNTSGHLEIKSLAPGAVSIFRQKNEKSLISSLNKFLIDKDSLEAAKAKSLLSLDGELGWESSREVLKKTVDELFKL